MYDECVCLCQQRCSPRLFWSRIPYYRACFFEGCVRREGIGGLVRCAGDQDVDLVWGDGEGGVIPGEGDGVDANFVVS